VVRPQTLLPIVPVAERPFGYPPRLTLEPGRFLGALVEHYLAAKLPALFFGSLMAENRRRLEHMETALNRMQTRMDDITRRRNALRQEEITEQIEIILLSVEAMPG
jgi:F-type H+-transporting ATPase subunit gamma